MSDYSKTVDFAAKDLLTSGNPAKVAKGTEVNTELTNIQTAILTKYDDGKVLRAADGTVGAPGISFNNDTDTGLYRSGSDAVVLSIGGGSAMQWLSSAGVTQVGAGNGTAASPSISFFNDFDTGLFRDASNSLSLVAGGANIVSVQPTVVFLNTGRLLTPDGSVSNPTFSFTGDSDTGIFRSGTNQLTIAAGGSAVANFVATHCDFNQQIQSVSGSASVPQYSFGADTDTGFYRDTSDQIAISLGGTTAGQIAQGTFTITYTGFTSNPTATATWQLIGKQVTLLLPAASGTSNSTSFGATGVPAVIRPTTLQAFALGSLLNNGGEVTGPVGTISSSGTFTFASQAFGGFTASGTKGLNVANSICWLLA